MLATGPLVGCAGADPASSSPPGGFGGSEASDGSAGGVGSAGTPVTNGGGSAAASSNNAGSAGNPFFNNGSQGGFSFGSGGSSTGTSTGGTSTGNSGGVASAGAPPSNNSLTALVNVSSVPIGGLVIAASTFFVGRDTKGIYVMSMQCTHKGCAVVFISGNKLDCPCHHSVFDFNGNVMVGPATTPLPHYAAFVDGAGNISVDRYAVVGGSVRVAV